MITLPLEYSYGTYDLPVKIGNSKQLTRLELNLKSTFMWISSLSIENNHEVSIKETIEDLVINQQQYKGQQIIGNVYLNNDTKIQNYPFYYISSSVARGYDTFSLSYSHKDKGYSVIHNLYTNKIIDKENFGFRYNLKNQIALLFIGGIPENILNDYTNTITLKMDGVASSWGAVLNKVTLSNEFSYEVNNFTTFQTNSKFINVPSKFMDFLKKEIFQDYFYNLTCISAIYLDGFGIECQYNLLKTFPDIIFTLNGNNFTLNKQDLFEITGGEMSRFLIRIEKNTYDHWEFGLPFVGKYLTSFDYDENAITFYSTNSFYIDKKTLNKTKLQRIILFMIIGELLFSIIGLIKKIF